MARKAKAHKTAQPRNEAWMRAKLDQARSGVQPRPVGTLYRRKRKHNGKDWE